MTTEELEKRLKISESTCVHCPTLELAKQVLNIFNKLGLKWCNGIYYTRCTDWDRYKENTIYYPFEGRFSSLKHFQQLNGKIISSEEFIALHTKKEKFDLENYIPKGDLKGFPKEVIARMLECQEEQGYQRDVSVFEKHKSSTKAEGGFDWDKTKEKWWFWAEVINIKNFNAFFEKYPKKEGTKACSKCHKEKPLSEFHKRGNTVRPECKECIKQEYQELKNNKNMQENNKKEEDSQEFRVGDKVIYFPTNKIGILTEIKKHKFDNDIDIVVDYGNNDISEYEIRSTLKRPFLLHYRDDYNYDVIDLNNLPKRQEPKRWRAEVGQRYYYINTLFEVSSFKEENHSTDTKLYNLGNYFQTEKKAQEVADILKKYFQELINKSF